MNDQRPEASRLGDYPLSQHDVELAMGELYDHYFASHEYERRYPNPNWSTLKFLLAHGAMTARSILDFGCGNGRYAMALLRSTQAKVTGYDISVAALQEFRGRIDQSQFGERVHLLHGPCAIPERAGRHDMILMLFGVLSHLGTRPARVAALSELHRAIEPNGRLVVTVPCVWRRRPVESLGVALARKLGRLSGPRTEAGTIFFTRKIGGVPEKFFYHLYSVKRLREELLAGGFALESVEAESILPEWLITQRPVIGWVDAQVSRLVPAWLGYGIRAIARPL